MSAASFQWKIVLSFHPECCWTASNQQQAYVGGLDPFYYIIYKAYIISPAHMCLVAVYSIYHIIDSLAAEIRYILVIE